MHLGCFKTPSAGKSDENLKNIDRASFCLHFAPLRPQGPKGKLLENLLGMA
jgi:hypothetical protein